MQKNEALVQMSRLALVGRRQDVYQYIRRMARNKNFADIKDELDTLLAEAPTQDSPVRNAQYDAVPVDMDSRMQLIRLEHHPFTDYEPVWTPEIDATLKQIIRERNQASHLVKAGLSPLRSVLFVGPPGVGKSLGARWLASQLGLPLLILDLSAVMSSFLGRTGTNLRMVLDYAKSVNCVLLLDEIDAIAKRRDDEGEIGELKRLVTVLLQEIDDWPSTGLMVAATNHPDLLDPAIWRRFETIIEFPSPDYVGIRRALSTFFASQGRRLSSTLLDTLALLLIGRSYSDIEKLCLRLRKESLLQKTSLQTLVGRYVDEHLMSLDKDRKYEITRYLDELKYSQRSIHELTGLSRDTIRKVLKKEE